jgi:hypothetical protein
VLDRITAMHINITDMVIERVFTYMVKIRKNSLTLKQIPYADGSGFVRGSCKALLNNLFSARRQMCKAPSTPGSNNETFKNSDYTMTGLSVNNLEGCERSDRGIT